MKKILLAVDNSALARKVTSLAVEQANALGAEVIVICCIDASYAATTGNAVIEAGEDPGDFGSALDEQNTAEAAVREALAVLQRAGVAATGRVMAGESAETIVALANETGAAMIIMGRRHLSSFNRLLKGSVSAAVIERASCPVLVDVRAD
ncbi:universal stress protein [Erwinia psidii]|uniref:Universal stress protein n=1 Tax=Erwinia psidii TaxID=69224 RepID=A0A3N6SQ98_9GAMM|nr:universal stress protein [Erwinia psidii]MCX8956687.1 universal stress protein [Erwinia psidii]MCX8960501.1 universal stress protein [Erwinia psidii]MCX8964316.1 universal stress protein [Erwinia psidii]RQM40016.1 universal stress protein [Erwinia psidii]